MKSKHFFQMLSEGFTPEHRKILLNIVNADLLFKEWILKDKVIDNLIDAFGKNLDQWRFGQIALHSVKIKPEEIENGLSNNLILAKVIKIYDHVRSGFQISSFEESVFLALALLVRWQKTGKWQGTINELLAKKNQEDYSFINCWKTSFAIVYDLTDEKESFVNSIIEETSEFLGVSLILHAVHSQFYDDKVKADILFSIMNDLPGASQVNLLQKMDQTRYAFIEKLARKLDTYGEQLRSSSDVSSYQVNIETSLRHAFISRLKGEDNHAIGYFRNARDQARQLISVLEILALSESETDGTYDYWKEPFVQNQAAQDILLSTISEDQIAADLLTSAKKQEGFIKKILEIKNNLPENGLSKTRELLHREFQHWFSCLKENWSEVNSQILLSKFNHEFLFEIFSEFSLPELIRQYADFLAVNTQAKEEIRMLLIDVYCRLRDEGKAYDLLKTVLIEKPQDISNKRKISHLLLKIKDWETLYYEWSSFENKDLMESNDWLVYAEAACEAGELEDAEQIAGKLIDQSYKRGKSLLILAKVDLSRGNVESARNKLIEITQSDPEIGDAWSTLAELSRQDGKYDEAITLLRSAVLAAPDDPRVHFALANACYDQMQYSEAVPYFRKAIGLDPQSVDYYLPLIKTLRLLGRVDEAEKILDTARMNWPHHPELAFLDGQRHVDNANPEQAVIAFENALNADFDNAPADWHFIYSKTLLEEKQNRLLITDGREFDTSTLIKAQKSLQKAMQNIRENGYIRLVLGEVYYLLGEHEAAHSLFCELVETDQIFEEIEDLDWRIFAAMGFVKTALGEIDSGLVMLAEAIKKNPHHIGTLKQLAKTYRLASLDDDAFKTAKEIYNLCSDDLDVVIWYADFMKTQQNSDEVLRALEQSLQLTTMEPDLINRLAVEYVVSGQEEKVEETLTLLKKKEAAACYEDFRNAAITFLRIKNKQSALEFFQLGLERADEKTLKNQLELNYLFMINSEWIEAADSLRKLISDHTEYRAIHAMFAYCLENLGKFDGALTSYENAIQWNQPINFANNFNETSNTIIPEEWSKHFQEEDQIRFKIIMLWVRKNEYFRAINALTELSGRLSDNISLKILDIELAIRVGDLYNAQQKIAILASLIEGDENIDKEVFRILFCYDQYLGFFTGSRNFEKTIWGYGENRLGSLSKIIDETKNHFFATDLRLLDQELATEESVAFPENMNGESDFRKTFFNSLEQRLFIIANFQVINFSNAEDCIRVWLEKPERYIEALFLKMVSMLQMEYYLPVLALSDLKIGLDESLRNEKKRIIQFEQLFRKVENHIGKNEFTRLFEKILQIRKSPEASEIHALLMQDINHIFKTWLISKLTTIGEFELAFGWVEKNKILDAELVMSTAVFPTNPDLVSHILADFDKKPSPLSFAILAKVFESQELFLDAIQMYEKALELWPSAIQWHINIAEISYMIGRFDLSLEHWQTAYVNSLNKDDIVFKYANVLISLDNSKEALRLLEECKDSVSDRYDYLTAYADACLHARQYGKAQSTLAELRRFVQDDPKVLLLDGRYLQATAQPDKAMMKLRRAITLAPSNSEGYSNLISILEDQKKYQEALKVTEEAVVNVEDNTQFLINRVWLLRENGNLTEAENLAMQLSEAFPENGELLGINAMIQSEKGNLEKAEEFARKSIRFNENQPAIQLLLGQIVRKQGHLDQALDYFGQAAKSMSIAVEPCLELSSVYVEQRNYEKALETYGEAIERNQKDYRPYFQAGLLMREIKDYQGAEKMLRIAADLAPKDANVRRHLAGVIALNFVHSPLEAN